MDRDVSLRRRTLHRSDALLIEDSALPFARALGRHYSPRDKFAFPYFGAFLWRVGQHERLVDPNCVLRVKGGEEFFETHPIPSVGHASAIFTPSWALLDELRRPVRAAKAKVPLTAPMNGRMRLRIHDLVGKHASELKRAEVGIDLLFEALRTEQGSTRRTLKLVERAKAILHQQFARPVTLEGIAKQLGVTPVYLTQAFRRQEGVPLYRYQTQLRLNRALWLLLRSERITDVALELGFSSHAHFTAAFTTAFGVSPTAYRSMH